MSDSKPQAYAVRRVNPFEGVLQVVETDHARGYSANGRVWQIQVIAERPDHTWRSFGDVPPIRQFFNFGLWDPQDGLQKVPANPVMDIGGMIEAAEGLIASLTGLIATLPFALIDDYECWATDHQGHPVALLATTENPAMLSDMRVERWQATRLGDHGFHSSTLDTAGVPRHGELGPRQHAEQLERQVRQLGQHKTWFQRLPDGRVQRIGTTGKPLAVVDDSFPPLGLKTEWKREQQRALARDYLEWLAPRLLMLPTLEDDQRATLERAACRRASELAAVYRLIPRIIDNDAIEAARVEARLRHAARQTIY